MNRFLRWLVIVAVGVTALGVAITGTPAPAAAQSTWNVQVFNNRDLAGVPAWTGTTAAVNFNWLQGPPVINGITTIPQTDNFSVRFVTTAFFSAGTYQFTVQVDDGARLFIDGVLVINDWREASLRTLQAQHTFPADGSHNITVEMFDAAVDATIIVSWALVGSGTPGTGGPLWYADFFVGPDLAGPVVYSTSYPASGLNLNWGTGSPGGTVPPDNFSARILRYLTVPNDMPQGVYTFYAYGDDGFRFYVDNTLIFDRWNTLATEQVQAEVTLLNGPHTFKVEYRELTSTAFLFLTWTPPAAQNPVLSPTGGSVAPAPPAGAITATVNVARLNVRTAPSTDSNVITTISRGQTYPATGRSGDNAWVRLTVSGQEGWSAARFLTLSGDINALPVIQDQGGPAQPTPPPQPTGVRGRVLANLRLRAEPTTRSAQLGTMPWGSEVDILGRSRNHAWYQVNFRGQIGWAFASWVRIIEGSFDALPYTDGPQPVFPPPEPTEGVIAQAFGNMRIRSGPGLQFETIGRAVWGTRVQVVGVSPDGNWLKVRHGDLIGWSSAPWYRIVQGSLSSVPVTAQ